MTTITIDEKTKAELLKIAAKLQIQIKKKVDYNTAIKFLINNYNKKKDEKKIRKACKKVKDINVDEVLNELFLERKKDELSI